MSQPYSSPVSEPQACHTPSIEPLELDIDSLLRLEETYHAEGHALGETDGTHAGLLEGRAFGLQRAFERFSAMGRLHGRSVIWTSRMGLEPAENRETTNAPEQKINDEEENHEPFLPSLPSASNPDLDIPDAAETQPNQKNLSTARWTQIKPTTRLRKHVTLLYGLTEPESLSMENTEDAVTEFEDRYKRATTKAGMISKLVGEIVEEVAGDGKKDTGIEDIDILKIRH